MAVLGSHWKWWVRRIHFLHPASVTAPCKAEVPREAGCLRGTPLGGLSTSKHRLQRLKVCKKQKQKQKTTASAWQKERIRADVPCRQIGHELDRSKSQGSTHAWWKTCLPSHGSTRTSSPSSKSTIHIGHVSRPIDSGSGSSSCADPDEDAATLGVDGPARGRAGGTSASSSCSCCATSSIPPAPASASPLAVASASACSVPAVGAGSCWVSFISCSE